jgi:hypothetical protein
MAQRNEAPTAAQRYPSLASFYNADPRRIESRELDVGLWWRQAEDGPLHRAAWISDTGELYLVRLGPAEQGGGSVEVLGTADSRRELDEAMRGWREQCGAPSSLAWLRRHANGLRGRLRVAPRTRINAGPSVLSV